MTQLILDPFAMKFMGVGTLQIVSDFILWEHIFERYDFQHVIELGTYAGGFSLYLKLQCVQRDIAMFHTVDCNIPSASSEGKLWHYLGMEHDFVQGDIFSDLMDIIQSWVKNTAGRVLLFCDNGNKPKEFACFVPTLRKGDVVIVHDWGTEISSLDTQSDLVIPIFETLCDEIGSMSRAFEKQ